MTQRWLTFISVSLSSSLWIRLRDTFCPFFFQERIMAKDGDIAFVSPLWIPLCFVQTLLELVCLLSCAPFRVSRVKKNKYLYSYCVSGSKNNMKKESTANRKILWYKIRLVRFSTEMHKPEGIAICLISLLISLLFPHLVLPPVSIQTYWPARGSAQLSPQKWVSNYKPCRYSFGWGIIKSLLPAANLLP